MYPGTMNQLHRYDDAQWAALCGWKVCTCLGCGKQALCAGPATQSWDLTLPTDQAMNILRGPRPYRRMHAHRQLAIEGDATPCPVSRDAGTMAASQTRREAIQRIIGASFGKHDNSNAGIST